MTEMATSLDFLLPNISFPDVSSGQKINIDDLKGSIEESIRSWQSRDSGIISIVAQNDGNTPSLSFLSDFQGTHFGPKLRDDRLFTQYCGALVIYGPDQLCWHMNIIAELALFHRWAFKANPLKMAETNNKSHFWLALVRLSDGLVDTNDELDRIICIMTRSICADLIYMGRKAIFLKYPTGNKIALDRFFKAKDNVTEEQIGECIERIDPTTSELCSVIQHYFDFIQRPDGAIGNTSFGTSGPWLSGDL